MKLPKFNYDENGNTPVRKGAKLPIQNEISKLPVPSFNPDWDEKPHNIISEASTSSIETISTVLIKEPDETFTKTDDLKHSWTTSNLQKTQMFSDEIQQF